MESGLYTIKCVTNMHMGSGDINFNIIDNEVQRDPITNLPTMFSSGIKGAFREHFKQNELVESIFGSDVKKSNADKKNSIPGKLKFLSGYLLFLPVRASKGCKSYYLVTTKDILDDFDIFCKAIKGEEYFGKDIATVDSSVTYGEKNAEIDGLHSDNQPISEELMIKFKNIVGNDNVDRVVITSEDNMKKINLPIIARNQLDNGISQNLWYEEVVPHETIFYTAIISDGTDDGNNAMNEFEKYINNNNLVQFGGNATIGYGLTHINKMEV